MKIKQPLKVVVEYFLIMVIFFAVNKFGTRVSQFYPWVGIIIILSSCFLYAPLVTALGDLSLHLEQERAKHESSHDQI